MYRPALMSMAKQQAATRSYYNYPWDRVLRYPGGGGVTPPQGVYIVRFVAA